jgi:hypothetical protein
MIRNGILSANLFSPMYIAYLCLTKGKAGGHWYESGFCLKSFLYVGVSSIYICKSLTLLLNLLTGYRNQEYKTFRRANKVYT